MFLRVTKSNTDDFRRLGLKNKFYIAAIFAVFISFALNADVAKASNLTTTVDKSIKKETEFKEIKEAIPVRPKEDIEKDISDVIKKNDELNDRVSKANISVIDAVKAFKNKKGISKKRLKVFSKNEPVIAEKTESLTKTIDGLRAIGEKISANDKSLDDVRKTLANPKTKNDKSVENELTLLEQGLALHIERGKILDSILGVLGEISGLIP